MSELEASLVYTVSPCLRNKEVSTSVLWYEVGIGWETGVRGPLRWSGVPLLCSKWARGGDGGFSRVSLGSWQEQRQDPVTYSGPALMVGIQGVISWLQIRARGSGSSPQHRAQQCLGRQLGWYLLPILPAPATQHPQPSSAGSTPASLASFFSDLVSCLRPSVVV